MIKYYKAPLSDDELQAVNVLTHTHMYVYVRMYMIITLKDEEVMKLVWTGRGTVKILKKERAR